MNEHQEAIEQPEVTVGERLKAAREAAGISVEEFAKQLNLMSSQLRKLENNEFEALGPATFVKGYIKNYCRVFSLNTDEILSLYKEDVGARQRATMQSFSRRTEKEAHDSRLMLVSYIILAVILGSSVFWWWQNSAQTSVIMPVSGGIAQPMPQQTSNAREDELVQTAEQQPAVEPSAQEPVESGEPQSAPSAQFDADSDASPESEMPLTSGERRIVMRFRADSWVEIIDATGERVAFGIKKAGYVMTLSGVAPFSVVLGKHDVVDIELDGEKVDISHFPKNRLAKFSLPLKE